MYHVCFDLVVVTLGKSAQERATTTIIEYYPRNEPVRWKNAIPKTLRKQLHCTTTSVSLHHPRNTTSPTLSISDIECSIFTLEHIVVQDSRKCWHVIFSPSGYAVVIFVVVSNVPIRLSTTWFICCTEAGA